jgi:hypothetical protein
MTRVIGPPKSRRRHWTFLGCLVLALGVAVFYIAGAQATPTDSGPQNNGLFELDGNSLVSSASGGGANGTTCPSTFPQTTAGLGDDWAALFSHPTSGTVNHPCGSDAFSFVQDNVGTATALGTSVDNTYWSGGGSKDAYDPATGPWMWSTTDVAPDKDDIVDAFAAIYHGQGSVSANDSFIYFGADRFATNGDAQMGFQFLQNPVCLAAIGTTVAEAPAGCPSTTPNQAANAGKFVDPGTGVPVDHANGDLLILVNFNSGGTLGLAGVFKWCPTAALTSCTAANAGQSDPGGQYDSAAPSGTNATGPASDCKTATGLIDFCSTASTTNSLSGQDPVWPYVKKGSTSSTTNTYDPSSFIEGGLNLSSVGLGAACFPSFIAETRSSAGPSSGLSLQAQLKDLAFGKFELCKPSTSLTKTNDTTGAIKINTTVTYTFKETNDGIDPLTPPAGATAAGRSSIVTDTGPDPNVSGSLDGSCSPVYSSGDSGPGAQTNNNILDPGETWTLTCTRTYSTAGVYTDVAVGHGLDARLGNKDVTVCADPTNPPTGVICDQDETAANSVTVINPSTVLTKAASPSAVVTVAYTYTEQNDGNDPLSPPGGSNPPVAADRSKFVTDPGCTGNGGTIAYAATQPSGKGDVNNNNILDPGETWSFTCTATYNVSGTGTSTFTDTATGHGIDSLGEDVSFCIQSGTNAGKSTDLLLTPCLHDTDEQKSKTVTVTIGVS